MTPALSNYDRLIPFCWFQLQNEPWMQALLRGRPTQQSRERPRTGQFPLAAVLPSPYRPATLHPPSSHDTPSQWVSRMGKLFFADEYVQRPGDPHTAVQTPEVQNAIRTVKGVLADLELGNWVFLWMASGTPNACQVRTRNQITPPLFHATEGLLVQRALPRLKVAASLDRTESFVKTIEGQVRCITAEFKQTGVNVAWNVSYINVFIPAWMVPPVYHSLRRQEIKCRKGQILTPNMVWRWDRSQNCCRTHAWTAPHPFSPQQTPQIRSPSRGGQAWPYCAWNMALQSSVYHPQDHDRPLLGTVIEQNGDGCLEDSLMPVGWPLYLDGAVKTKSLHRATILSELDEILQAWHETKSCRAAEEARTCEAWFQLTFRPQKWNLKAHMWYQLSPFPSSNAAIAMQHHPCNIHQSVATPRYSATPWYVLIQLPNVIDTTTKQWRSKKAFNTSPFHIFP